MCHYSGSSFSFFCLFLMEDQRPQRTCTFCKEDTTEYSVLCPSTKLSIPSDLDIVCCLKKCFNSIQEKDFCFACKKIFDAKLGSKSYRCVDCNITRVCAEHMDCMNMCKGCQKRVVCWNCYQCNLCGNCLKLKKEKEKLLSQKTTKAYRLFF